MKNELTNNDKLIIKIAIDCRKAWARHSNGSDLYQAQYDNVIQLLKNNGLVDNFYLEINGK